MNDLILFIDIINDGRIGNTVNMSKLKRVRNSDIAKLLYDVYPIIKPLDAKLCSNIDPDEEHFILSLLDVTEDGYVNAYEYYKSIGFHDEDIISIFVVHILLNKLEGKDKNNNGLSKLYDRLNERSLRYIKLCDK